jgi:threonine/homoserine/homoserine lactone efflux protein
LEFSGRLFPRCNGKAIRRPLRLRPQNVRWIGLSDTAPRVSVGALTVAYLVPGPNMKLILQTGAIRGRAKALAVACGFALARAAHVFLAAIGLAALLKTAPWTFEIVRIGGVAYLIWLGIGILRSRYTLPEEAAIPGTDAGWSWFGSLRRGLLTNILNPKALQFCSVLLP